MEVKSVYSFEKLVKFYEGARTVSEETMNMGWNESGGHSKKGGSFAF